MNSKRNWVCVFVALLFAIVFINRLYLEVKSLSVYQVDDSYVGEYEVVLMGDDLRYEAGEVLLLNVSDISGHGYEIQREKIIQINPDEIVGDRIRILELDAMCDSLYIYDGTMTYENGDGNTYVYEIAPREANAAISGTERRITEEDIREGNPVPGFVGSYGWLLIDREDITELDEKARDMFMRIVVGRLRTTQGFVYFEDEKDFFGSTHIESYSLIREVTYDTNDGWTSIEELNESSYMRAYKLSYFNPMGHILRENLMPYILALIALIIVEAVIVIVSNILKKDYQKEESREASLTRGIAHDIKTPLAVTRAIVENWEYLDENDKDEYAQKLTDEVDNMSQMLDNLIVKDSLDSDAIELNLEKVNLEAVLEEVNEQIMPLVKERGLNITLHGMGEENHYAVVADKSLIKMVIGNFVSNAVKYADKNIDMKLETAGKRVRFEITNDGATISKKDQKRVWDVFYKTDKSRTNRIASSGIGLSIAKSILDLHKAKYGCTSSDKEKRTTFWFEIKRSK